MGILYLVRHGQASGNDGSYDGLTDLGREQARAVGAELARRGVQPDLVVTGELRRQRETADELLAMLDEAPVGWSVPVRKTDGRWDEYDHLALLAAHEPRHRDPIALATDISTAPRPGRALQDLLDTALRTWMTADSADRAGRADRAGEAGRADRAGEAGRAEGYAETFPAFRARVRAALDEVTAAGRATAVVVSSGGPISAICAGLLGVPADGWLALNRVIVNTSITAVLVGGRGASLLTYNDHAHVAGDGRRLLTYR